MRRIERPTRCGFHRRRGRPGGRGALAAALAASVAIAAAVGTAPVARAGGTWAWPVVGPVLRGFDPPEDPYGSGHRGIDIAAIVGSPVGATAAGVVSFAGPVGGHLFVSIDHGGGLVSSYSWLSALYVRTGDVVARGQPVAASGLGHPGDELPSLHLGVRLGGAYVDPLDYLEPLGVTDFIRLAPVPVGWPA